MAHRDFVPVTIRVEAPGFDLIAKKLGASLSAIDEISNALHDNGRLFQRRAVSNVSGNPRQYNGRRFIVNRQTGKLARSIQLSYPNPLAVMLDATADYASDVEEGDAWTRRPQEDEARG